MIHLKYIPYTYCIGWPELDLWYYGVRYHKKHQANPVDLWTTYFTSSNDVKEMRKYWGEPSFIQIRKTFSTFEAAREWESRVLKRLKVRTNPRWLNKCSNHKAVDQTGLKRSVESRKKMSEARKNCIYTEEGRNKLKLRPIRKQSIEERKKRSEYWKTNNPSNNEITKQKQREKLRVLFSGKGNPRFDHTIYTFKNDSGEEYIGLRCDFICKYNLNSSGVSGMIKHNKQYKHWCVDRAEFSRANFTPKETHK